MYLFACFSNGNIVVIDTRNKRLSTFNSTGCFKTTGVQSQTEEGTLENPFDLAITCDDMILVIDGQNV